MIKTYTQANIKNSKDPFAIWNNSTSLWYTFPSATVEASLSDYKVWGEGSGRDTTSMTGEMKATLIGIFPKLELKIGKQNAQDRSTLTALLNKPSVKVRAFCVERQRFEEANFYFGDVINKIKKWDKNGTLGNYMTATGNQTYTCNSTFEPISFSVISLKRRS